jgi:hypothetical protein
MSTMIVTADAGGPTISRHIYGHFAEHLGRCIYEGIWVGEDSPIPNTRGIRNDVVAALKRIGIPNLRWPGGCFADTYHWKDGLGPRGQCDFCRWGARGTAVLTTKARRTRRRREKLGNTPFSAPVVRIPRSERPCPQGEDKYPACVDLVASGPNPREMLAQTCHSFVSFVASW